MDSLLKRLSASADELRSTRVKNTVELLSEANFILITERKSSMLEYINKIEKLLDLGANSTTDIASNLQKVNPKEWANEFDNALIELVARIRNLNTRIIINNELFPEKKIEPLKYGDYGGIADTILKEIFHTKCHTNKRPKWNSRQTSNQNKNRQNGNR